MYYQLFTIAIEIYLPPNLNIKQLPVFTFLNVKYTFTNTHIFMIIQTIFLLTFS
mgnify:CR=1 FL=1